MAAVGEVFNTLVGTLIKTGSLLKNLVTLNFKGMRDDVKAIGDQWRNVGSNIKSATDLVSAEIALSKARRKNLVDEATIMRDIAKARLDAADKTKKNQDRVESLKKSLELEKKIN